MCFLFVGCGKPTITNIEKTGTNGNTDIYTIYYSNGTTSTLNIENGKDGENGADLDLKALYDLCVQNNLYSGSFQSFLQDYISNKTNENVGINSAMNSIVSIYAAFKTTLYEGTAYEIGAGAGVIYKMDGNLSYILTNCHVVCDGISALSNKLPETIMVWQYGATVDIRGTKHNLNSKLLASYQLLGGVSAKCVGYSIDYDLAILQVNTADLLAFNADACAVTLADSYSIAEKVYAIGNPEAEGISVTSGIISVVSEEIAIPNFPADSKTHKFRVMRIDVPIYPGNSGGGLFNEFGKLVGIVNAGWVTTSEVADNYNYTLPIDNVKQVADNLIYYAENGTQTFCLKQLTLNELGATLDEKFKDFNEITGELNYNVSVANLTQNSLLKSCNMQVGDIITSLTIDNETYNITRYFQIDDLLISARKNSKITFHVLRGETEAVVNLLNFESLI